MSIPFFYIALLSLSILLTWLLLRRKTYSRSEDSRRRIIKRVEIDGEGIPIDFNSCEFKSSTFTEEVPEDVSNELLAADLASVLSGEPSVALGSTRMVKKERFQSVLFYQDPSLLSGVRLHQEFPMDIMTLKYHVLEGHIRLYISKDKRAYSFQRKS